MSEHTIEKYAGNILNAQGVGTQNDRVVVLHPLVQMSKSAALVHAAWLVAIADQSENFEEFRSILKAVLEA